MPLALAGPRSRDLRPRDKGRVSRGRNFPRTARRIFRGPLSRSRLRSRGAAIPGNSALPRVTR